MAQTSSKGLGRVRQVWGEATSLGRWPRCRYLRAVFSSMFDRRAAWANGVPSASRRNNLWTCLSVTIATLLVRGSCDQLTAPSGPGNLIVVGRRG